MDKLTAARSAFGHHKAMFGVLAMFKAIADGYDVVSFETFSEVKVYAVHVYRKRSTGPLHQLSNSSFLGGFIRSSGVCQERRGATTVHSLLLGGDFSTDRPFFYRQWLPYHLNRIGLAHHLNRVTLPYHLCKFRTWSR